MKPKSKSPLSDFFLNDAPPADGSAVGREHAMIMVATLKRDHVEMELQVLHGYLIAWNERWGSPFTKQELSDLVQVKPLMKTKPTLRPDPENFAIRLLEE